VLVSSLWKEREGVERAGGCAEMPLGQMQVDGSDLEVSMAKQNLDGAQVSAGFEKVCGEAVSKRVRMDMPVLKAGAFGGQLAGRPEDLGGHGMTRCVPAVAWKEPLLRLAPEAAPVDTQFFEQLRAEHDIASLPPLPSRIWTTIRWLSMSLTFRWAASARRAPVA